MARREFGVIQREVELTFPLAPKAGAVRVTPTPQYKFPPQLSREGPDAERRGRERVAERAYPLFGRKENMECSHEVLKKLEGAIEDSRSYRCQACGTLMTAKELVIGISYGLPKE